LSTAELLKEAVRKLTAITSSLHSVPPLCFRWVSGVSS